MFLSEKLLYKAGFKSQVFLSKFIKPLSVSSKCFHIFSMSISNKSDRVLSNVKINADTSQQLEKVIQAISANEQRNQRKDKKKSLD